MDLIAEAFRQLCNYALSHAELARNKSATGGKKKALPAVGATPEDRGDPQNWTGWQRRTQMERSAQKTVLGLSRSPAHERPRADSEKTLSSKSSEGLTQGPFTQKGKGVT